MSNIRAVTLRGVGFAHESAADSLFIDLNAHFPIGFTGIMGANGAGKTTLLELVTGQRTPQSGHVERPLRAILCPQRTDDPPEQLPDLLADWHSEAHQLRVILGLDEDYAERWMSLSHGERKRAQIGSALWTAPDVLAIDEPTNHIDRAARARLIEALHRFRGVGLLVSHDRELQDALCSQSLWIDPPTATLYPGGYTAARAQRDQAHARAIEARAQARHTLTRLLTVQSERREFARGESHRRSKRGIARNDHDAKAKIDLARVTDGSSGASLRQLAGRVRRASEQLEAAVVDKAHTTGVWFSAGRSPRRVLAHLAANDLPLGGGRQLRHPDLHIGPVDRIGISGPNGAGKSTLLRELLASTNVPIPLRVYLPQEIARDAAVAALDAARARTPAERARLMQVVSRLGSRPERLLVSVTPSPGETRKLLLAEGIIREPHLIVLDEPTNHLDLSSIEALEQALSECPCALIIVSHDERLLQRLTTTRWVIEPGATSLLRIST